MVFALVSKHFWKKDHERNSLKMNYLITMWDEFQIELRSSRRHLYRF
jgi:hypothetical protein